MTTEKLSDLFDRYSALGIEVSAEIADTFPVGSKVEILVGDTWEPAEVTWCPHKNSAANHHIYVKRLKTGGSRKYIFSKGGFQGLRPKAE